MLALAGCSKDKTTNPNPNPGGSTTYTGTVTGTGANGKLTITLATSTPAPQEGSFRATAVVNATGTFTPAGGAPIGLTGNYDDSAKLVGLSGGGWDFSGQKTSSGLDGTAGGPSGQIGTFSVLEGTTAVTVIIGRFTSTTQPPGDSGDFNISINGTAVHGNAVPDGQTTAIPLNGTFNPANGNITIPGLAIGNYNSTTGNASGTFDTGSGNSGTWAGARQ
jgi:hypothetical protein